MNVESGVLFTFYVYVFPFLNGLGPDYMRTVRTQTGTTRTRTITFTWDRSENMTRLHETGTRFQIGMKCFRERKYF